MIFSDFLMIFHGWVQWNTPKEESKLSLIEARKLKNLKEHFILTEPPFEQHRFNFALEMPEDKKITFEMAGRFWNWARSSGVDSQLKTEYFGNSVRFYHVAVAGEKGKLVSTWDGKCESWKLEPDNLKQLGDWTVEQIHTVLN